MAVQCEGMGEVGSARYEPALLPPCPSIRALSYSNCQRSTHSNIRAWQCKCYMMSMMNDITHTQAFSAQTLLPLPSLAISTLHKNATIHQVTTMLATSRNVLFQGHNHLQTTGTDDLTLSLLPELQRVKGHVPVVSRWL